jgi:ribosomal protein S18 acetylase RimI-like enzyme
MRLKLRQMKKSDLSQACKIQKSFFGESAEFNSEDELSDVISRWPNLAIAAESNDEFTGFLVAYHFGKTATIQMLAVAPEFQRQGIASCLLAELEKRLKSKGITNIELAANAANKSAIKFYEKMGFKEIAKFLGMRKKI